MTKKELFEGAGKYWVRTKSNEIGCVMNNGIVFSEGIIHKDFYSNDLKVDYHEYEGIFQVLIPKQDNTDCYEIEHFNVVETIKHLRPITSLNQLEEVRKEMCEKYGNANRFKFFITNEGGEYNILCNNVLVGRTCDSKIKIDLYNTYPCEYKIESYTKDFIPQEIYVTYKGLNILEKNIIVDLEKEGYELKLGGDKIDRNFKLYI